MNAKVSAQKKNRSASPHPAVSVLDVVECCRNDSSVSSPQCMPYSAAFLQHFVLFCFASGLVGW